MMPKQSMEWSDEWLRKVAEEETAAGWINIGSLPEAFNTIVQTLPIEEVKKRYPDKFATEEID
jgi:hypothetical protein